MKIGYIGKSAAIMALANAEQVGYKGKTVSLMALANAEIDSMELTKIKERDYDLPSSPPAMRRRVRKREDKLNRRLTRKLQERFNERTGYGLRITKNK